MSRIITLLFVLFISFNLLGQEFVVKGKVRDESGDPLIGVSVSIKGNLTKGTITDMEGQFSFRVSKEKEILVFSFIGFKTKEVEVTSSKSYIEVILEEEASLLEEVVVTGYATVRKRDIVSASISYVDGSAELIRGRSGGVDSYGAGLLTAGEVNDFTKWLFWNDEILEKTHKEFIDIWKIKPKERYMVQVVNKNNMPLVDATVRLLDKNKKIVWESRSDNTGKAELWANFSTNEQNGNKFSIESEYRGVKESISKIKQFDKGINRIELEVDCSNVYTTDILFIVDATGSMGDEIGYLQAELTDVIKRVKEAQPSLNINMGSVFYRDHGDEYLTCSSAFSPEVSKTVDFMNEQSANGGGDEPEAVDQALMIAVDSMGWRDEALSRIAFLVLDAPCHDDDESLARMNKSIRAAAKKGIRLVPVVCSGMGMHGEYLLRSMALATNGTTLFLTDDSGIGNTHLKPTTDKLEVEMLNDMLVRIVLQYTNMPECENELWLEEEKEDKEIEKFLPDPYDAEPEDMVEEDEDKKTPEKVFVAKDIFIGYPVPCVDELNIQIKEPVQDLYLMDISGKYLQRKGKLEKGDTVSMYVSSYSTGVYFIRGFSKGRWYTQKIIKR